MVGLPNTQFAATVAGLRRQAKLIAGGRHAGRCPRRWGGGVDRRPRHASGRAAACSPHRPAAGGPGRPCRREHGGLPPTEAGPGCWLAGAASVPAVGSQD